MKKRYLTLFTCLVLIAALLTGCGGSADNAAGFDFEYSMEETAAAATYAAESPREAVTSSSSLSDYSDPEAKLVKTVYLDAQTKTYDTLIPSIEEKITALGGYIENRDAYNGSMYREYDTRSCSMNIRIPADRLNEFVTHVNENANVVTSSESVENITLQYVDTASRVEALEAEQDRLLELLESAQNLTEILEIEARLSDVRYELESYASQLRVMDNQVEYATVYLTIDEVEKLTPVEEPSVWDRITGEFTDSVTDIADGAVDLFVWFVGNSPKILIFAAVVTGIILICRTASRRRKKKKAAKQAEQSE